MNRAAPVPTPPAAVALTAWCIHVPAVALVIGRYDLSGALPAERASELLGRKGLIAKEQSTRLALCAVHRALDLAVGERPAGRPDPDTGVVVASNLGNVRTVRETVATLREHSWRQVSPLTAPNASSNVIASTIAIRFRLGGPNLTVCSGATAGLDALALAMLLLRAERARRVLVVGVEPDDDVATELQRRRGAREAGTLRAGASCLVLERAGAAGAPPLIGDVRTVAAPEAAPACPDAPLDLGATIGDMYGAAGVLQVAAAAALLEGPPRLACARVVCGDSADGWRTVDVLAGGGAG
jgi:3-oxoacyl-[acyl-carrier-protein] synthase II